jgi:esterase
MLFTSRVLGASPPRRWALFLHGILGTGPNLRALAKHFIEAREAEGWGAILVDLRAHGRSQDLPPPHTMEACVRDLEELAAAESLPVDAVIGHSFGGKIALLYASAKEGDLSYVAVLDSAPSARPSGEGSESILHVLQALALLPSTFQKREDFSAQLLTQQGITPGIAAWLAMNLEARDNTYRFRLNLHTIRELLADYFEQDAWPVLETLPGRVVFDMVLGGKSNVLSPSDRTRLHAAEAQSQGRVRTVTLANAGHWVHVDDPEGLQKALSERTLQEALP